MTTIEKLLEAINKISPFHYYIQKVVLEDEFKYDLCRGVKNEQGVIIFELGSQADITEMLQEILFIHKAK